MTDNILKLPYRIKATRTPHIYWVDLFNNGVAVEVAVMALDPRNKDLHYIRTDLLDEIDKARLTKVLSRRDARNYPLWDLLSQQTLKNGMNALEFFHQFVKILTVNHQHLPGGSTMRGFGDMPKTTFTSDETFDLTNDDSFSHQPDAAPKKRAGRPPSKKV